MIPTDVVPVRENVPLGPLTTYKLGGAARYFVEIESLDQLLRFVGRGLDPSLEILTVGRGSNLVVADGGFPGLAIHLGPGFQGIELAGLTVTAGAAVSLPRLARATVRSGLGGLEFFVGVPGSVGGAIRQNAGCFGTETKDVLESASVVDLDNGEMISRDALSFEFAYRHSNLRSRELVVEAGFRVHPGDRERGERTLREITRWRRDHQPGGTLNAGSVFKNPPHKAAGAIIDELGLKGLRVGDVSVSEKHANFFVAGPEATAAEIRALVELVKDRVHEATGTILEPEIQFVGFEE